LSLNKEKLVRSSYVQTPLIPIPSSLQITTISPPTSKLIHLMKRLHVFTLIASVLIGSLGTACLRAESSTSLAPRERLLFNNGWSFQKGEPSSVGDALSYLNNRAVAEAVIASASDAGLTEAQRDLGKENPFVQPGYSDQNWRKLDLPHDWGIEGPFDQKLPGGTGKLPWVGIGWYRKTFALPAADARRQISLVIDGAMSYAMVWCNGAFVGGWPYGYSSFRFDLTPYLKPGADNVLASDRKSLFVGGRWEAGRSGESA
jgi:beta-galactosidase